MKYFLTILATFILTWATGQNNLVPNPSFEDTVYCPLTLADLSATTFWSAPTQGSPDYFNSCSNNPNIEIPINAFGSQSAHFGTAYVGISVYDLQNTYSYREYIQTQLQQQLVDGQKYFVSFYVSLADLNDYGIKELGAYFSPSQVIDNSMDSTLSLLPQIEFNGSVVTDKINWVKISGSFIANGTENFLVIGNFNRKQTTTAIQVGTNNVNYAYYYIDDVCVSTDSLACAQLNDINKVLISNNFRLYPNPASRNAVLSFDNSKKEICTLTLYNHDGQIIQTINNIISDQVIIQKNDLTNGVYYFVLRTNDRVIATGKLAVD